jgi:hypothetical protein
MENIPSNLSGRLPFVICYNGMKFYAKEYRYHEDTIILLSLYLIPTTENEYVNWSKAEERSAS